MRIFGLIAVYAVALFLTGWLLLDVESMLISELSANEELDIPENVLLDALEEMRYWNRLSLFFTFLILVVKCSLMALVLYGGLFFANLHQGIRLSALFRVTVFAEVALVLAGVVKMWVVAVSEYTYSEFAIFYPGSLLSALDITHQPMLASTLDRILILDKGGIMYSYTPKELMKTNTPFSEVCRYILQPHNNTSWQA